MDNSETVVKMRLPDFVCLQLRGRRRSDGDRLRFGVDNYAARPFYLDDHTVVIHTPGGVFLGVDTVSGKVESLMKEFSPIQDLSVHPQKRLLLVGTKGSAQGLSCLNLLGLA
jgi:hypothetical protein